jgi:hypothetical protein
MPLVNNTNMEKAKPNKTTKVDHRSKIIAGYVEHVLEHGKQPASVFKFAKALKMNEEDFYNYFTSFEAIKSAVWSKLFEDTINNLESQEVFKEYSAREKTPWVSFHPCGRAKEKPFLIYFLSMGRRKT